MWLTGGERAPNRRKIRLRISRGSEISHLPPREKHDVVQEVEDAGTGLVEAAHHGGAAQGDFLEEGHHPERSRRVCFMLVFMDCKRVIVITRRRRKR